MSSMFEFSPIMMSFVAGMSTGLGGCVIFFVQKVSNKVMSFTLSLAAGVMTSVSILELLKPILDGSIPPLLWALAGAGFYIALRKIVPEPPKIVPFESASAKYDKRERITSEDISINDLELLRARNWRLGILMMLTLTAHNLPEGVAVAIGAMSSTHTGLVVMFAIAMHNIPEGLAIAIPIFAATGSRWKALGMTLASGLSEPIGASIGVYMIGPFIDQEVVDYATCSVGGIMLAVSFLELIPEAHIYNEPKYSMLGVCAGWLVILLTVSIA